MKTTELYIEQVLIGLLVILIGVLPWIGQLSEKFPASTATLLAEGSVLLGVGFWLGIPFDRFADTLLERLERQNRLQFALNNAVGKHLEKDADGKLKDIYPEDRLRLKGWRDEEGVVNWLEYARSRIRLARALAVYGPAWTLSLTIAVSPTLKAASNYEKSVWLIAVIGGYVLWAVLANPPRAPKSKEEKKWLHSVFGTTLPRTDKNDFVEYAKDWNRLGECAAIKSRDYGDYRVWLTEWRSLIVPFFIFLTAAWLASDSRRAAMVVLIGFTLTLLAGWSWWRISYTYRTYLSQLNEDKTA